MRILPYLFLFGNLTHFYNTLFSFSFRCPGCPLIHFILSSKPQGFDKGLCYRGHFADKGTEDGDVRVTCPRSRGWIGTVEHTSLQCFLSKKKRKKSLISSIFPLNNPVRFQSCENWRGLGGG